MNSKQVRSILCGLSPEEQDILQDEYGISARVSDVGPGVTENMKVNAAELMYGITSIYTLTNRPDEFRCFCNAASHKHAKPDRQRAKEVSKRRKNNRNKKTHRKK